MSEYALGIDTSNYKTSLAIIDREGNIFYDDRIPLRVSQGEKGLRQQEAVFQHIHNLPRLIKDALSYIDRSSIKVISVSDKPRNVEKSYMPCFMAGKAIGESLAAALNIPIEFVSHQQGHLEAGRRFTELKDASKYLAFHFSGGTTEALAVDGESIEIVGGTKDISFGQLLDRVGVAMGFPFPAGEEIDNGAIRAGSGNIVYKYGSKQDSTAINHQLLNNIRDIVPVIKVDNPYINLSGIETAILRWLDRRMNLDEETKDQVSLAVLLQIGDAIIKIMDKIVQENPDYPKSFLFVGGVSSSSFLRSYIEKKVVNKDIKVCFASPELASDNAVGVALLGGDSIWR